MNIYIKYIKGFPDLYPDTAFLKSDAESLPFEDNRFDFIICTNALDHFNDVRKATVEMGRVLQPGGKLFLNVDCKNRLNVRIRKRVGHPYSFTPAKIQELFEPTCLNVTFEQSFDIGPSHTMHFIKE
jgi:ubiquinone/menaquinone biosynthesis C-methylase UbiE